MNRDDALLAAVERAMTGANIHAVRQVLTMYLARADLAEARRRQGRPDLLGEQATEALARALRAFTSHGLVSRLRDEAAAAAALDAGAAGTCKEESMDKTLNLTDETIIALCKAGVKMETVILDTEVAYSVVIGDDDETASENAARTIWHRRVPFGDDDAHCAGGAAFGVAARRQEDIAWSCAHAGRREEVPETIRSLRRAPVGER